MSFNFLQGQVLDDSDIDADGVLWAGPDQSNSPYKPSMRAVIDYSAMSPADGTVRLQAVLQGKSPGGTYYPIAPQNDPFYGWFDQQREIIADSKMFWPDAGIDNIVSVGGTTVAQISPTQVTLPDTWRLIIVADKDPGATLGSVTLSVFGEVYE